MVEKNAVRENEDAAYAQDLIDFIAAAPTSFHAVAEAACRLEALGFTRQDETRQWSAAPGGHYLVRDGALVVWYLPTGAASASAVNGGKAAADDNETDGAARRFEYRIIGVHTDSPGLRVKPSITSTSADGWRQVNVETYGGLLHNSWLDRDLGIAGRLVDHTGTIHLVRTGPIMRIPQLAIHLDRGVNDGLRLDPQRHLQPIWAVDCPEDDFWSYLAEQAGLEVDEIAGHDLFAYDTQQGELLGLTGEFLACGRLDNLVSLHASLQAVASFCGSAAQQTPTGQPLAIPVLAAFDHEEVGSESRTGAAGPLLEDVLRRLAVALQWDEDSYRAALTASICLSVDAGHAVHPNYPEKHDPHSRPMLGQGPILKINAKQRYMTDGVGQAFWNQLCAQAGVESQDFVSHNAVPCGSTIGPLAATRLGMRTIDVGVPLLSMHSVRELISPRDARQLAAVLACFLGA